MLFNSVLASVLIGLSAAAPFTKSPAHKFQPGGNFAWQPVIGKDLSASKDPQANNKRIGPVALAVGGAVLGGVVGPVITRAFNDVLGVQKKKRAASHVDVGALSWEEVKKVFVDSSVEALFEADEGRDADAAVCVGVGYSVADPSKTVDSASFKLQADGQEEEYDCFILEGPTTFTVPVNTSDSEVAVKFGGHGTFVGGVLTIN